jgi:hypothetical protein
MWIGPDIRDVRLEVGAVGFLIERVNEFQGSRHFTLEAHPPRTNQSHMPRLTGWCGTTNNVGVFGHSIAKVTRLARNGRAEVCELVGAELRAAALHLGYPDLIPAKEEA